MKQNNDATINTRIINLLIEADKPLIAHHIAKGIKETPQLVDYHLKKLVDQGIVLVDESYGTKFFVLQPPFYMESAESVLLQSLIPWATEFSKQCIIVEDESQRAKITINSIHEYLIRLLLDLKRELDKTNLQDSKTNIKTS